MTTLTQAYSLKISQDATLRQQLDHLRELVSHACQQLLESLWADHWIERLAASRQKKAYKVINEQRVRLTTNTGSAVYLPSRIRRCIAEQVVRILRSQATRKDCYYDVLRVVQFTGVV